MNFDYSASLPSLCTPVTMGAVAAIHEYKGKQELYQALKPEPFEKLAAVARRTKSKASKPLMFAWRLWLQKRSRLITAMNAKLRDIGTCWILSMSGMPI